MLIGNPVKYLGPLQFAATFESTIINICRRLRDRKTGIQRALQRYEERGRERGEFSGEAHKSDGSVFYGVYVRA